jgi:hypothetical protein
MHANLSFLVGSLPAHVLLTLILGTLIIFVRSLLRLAVTRPPILDRLETRTCPRIAVTSEPLLI